MNENKYKKIWSEFCLKVERFKNEKSAERPFHDRLEDAFGILGWFKSADEIVHEYKASYGSGNNMKIDFVLQKTGSTDNIVIPVEVKRPGKKIGEKEANQISSYIKVLPISYGLLIADNIELYYQKSAEDEPVMIRRWKLSVEEKSATEFVSLFHSDDFDSIRVKEYCKKQYDKAEAKKLICSDFVKECLKNALTSNLCIENNEVDKLLEEYEIIVKPKSKELVQQENKTVIVEQHVSKTNVNFGEHKNTWLIPSNKSFFDIDACIGKYGEVYWRQRNNFNSGDDGYIYSSSPDQYIKYSFEIVKTDLKYDSFIDRQKEFHCDLSDFEEAKEHNRYALLRITGSSRNPELSAKAMYKNGLKGYLQGPMILSYSKYESLLKFIEENFNPNN